MALISPYPSTVTLNVNELNYPVKRHKIHLRIFKNGYIIKQKTKSTYICLQETQFSFKDTQTENEGISKDIPCKWKPIKSWGSYT